MSDQRDFVFLVGFMCSGKTTVGEALAQELGLPWVDIDARVEAATGESIAGIFANGGEERFRELESSALRMVADGPPAVVSTGGGVVLSSANRALLRASGFVIHLGIDANEAVARAGDSGSRPLLAGARRGSLLAMLAERGPLYESVADVTLCTSDRPPKEVVRMAVRAIAEAGGGVRPSSYSVAVSHRFGAYRVDVCAGLLAEAGSRLWAAGLRGKAMVVTNPTVAGEYLPRLTRSLEAAGFEYDVCQVPDGEEFKSVRVASAIWDRALAAGLDRTSFLVALGGGVVCDMTGFAAATFMRGVRFAQIPTTLLAQVDASVGGKVAVNLGGGKNAVGAFHQPSAVLIDPLTLATLSQRDVRSGLAEMVKHGAALDPELFAQMEALTASQLADPETMAQLIHRNVEAKAGVVSADETETGVRAVLNLGHTLAHALETKTRYAVLRHGEAVGIGVAFATRISQRLGMIGQAQADRVVAALRGLGVPTDLGALPVSLTARELVSEMRKDKKAEAGTPRFVLLEGIGRAVYGVQVDESCLLEALTDLRVGGDGA